MTKQNGSTSLPISRSKRRLAALALGVLGVVCACVYLIGVFLAAHTRSTSYFPKDSKAAVAHGQLPDHCKQALKHANLNSAGRGRRPPQFREFGSLWRWESARTVMFSSQLLDSPECVGAYLNVFRLAIPSREIVVIYDVEQDRPVLVVRNFE